MTLMTALAVVMMSMNESSRSDAECGPSPLAVKLAGLCAQR
ncbi:hypothetical protein [Rhodococcus sp. ACT016]